MKNIIIKNRLLAISKIAFFSLAILMGNACSDDDTKEVLPPDEPNVPDVPDIPEVPSKAYFVKQEKAGSGSGEDWDNAMGTAELRDLLNSSAEATGDVENMTFHVAQGTYLIGDKPEGVTIAYKGLEKQVVIKFWGGYDPASTGTDLDKRDIANPTIFTGDVNGNGEADEGDYSLFTLGAYTDVTFDGFTFSQGFHANNSDNSYGSGFYVAHAEATLQLNHCSIRKCRNNRIETEGAGGSAIFIDHGIVKLNDVLVKENATGDGGSLGTIRSKNNDVVLFINGSRINFNTGREYGYAIQMSAGNLCMNNTFLIANWGSEGSINGAAAMLLVNNTMIEGRPGILLRCESTPSQQSCLMNNIIITGGVVDYPLVNVSDPDKCRLTSKGYNLFGGIAPNNSGFIPSNTDLYGCTEWDSNGHKLGFNYNGEKEISEWDENIAALGFTPTTLSAVKSAINEFDPDSRPAKIEQSLGKEFLGWLESIKAFPAEGNLIPGSYQK